MNFEPISEKYIEPTLHVHSTFADAKEFYDSPVPPEFRADKKCLNISDVAKGKRNLIIGEPGIGKSKLLSKIQTHLDRGGISTCFIALKNANSIRLIHEFLGNRASSQSALLLDGFDEIQGSLFPAVLEAIESISRTRSELSIYISSRSAIAGRYAANFPGYRFITISPFSSEQVRNYLVSNGQIASEVDSFLSRVMSFDHGLLVIQIPRYLFLLSEFLAEHEIATVRELSRNKLFDYFIYAKLKLEDKASDAENVAITERLLEKLALTMEVYQTNEISKDEFMTFLDDLQSDLKVTALTQFSLRKLFENSLLKDNGESIEFDNTEFQEYLAAKEITRFADPRLAAFTLSVADGINEIPAPWFNTLSFLVDMRPDLIEQLIEFSGIRGAKLIDEPFVRFLSRINPTAMGNPLKHALFCDLVGYHQRHLHWIPGGLAWFLPRLFDASHELLLKSGVAAANSETGEKRFVSLGNIALVIGCLLESGTSLDRVYWRRQLMEFACDSNDNGVLQRYALFALEKLNDPTVVDQLPFPFNESDELIVRAFLTLCTAIGPENPTSIEYFFEATIKGEICGRYGLYALKERRSLKSFLERFNTDQIFRERFLDKCSIFKEKDRIIVDHISEVCDEELVTLCKEAISWTFQGYFSHDAGRSSFILALGAFLKDEDSDFLASMVNEIWLRQSAVGFFYTREFFATILAAPDIPRFLAGMIAAKQQMSAFAVMLTIKTSNVEKGEEIFEAGRPYLQQQYTEWDRTQCIAPESPTVVRQRQILNEFNNRLEPAPQQFGLGVFAFYLEHVKQLDPVLSPTAISRLSDLITGSVFKAIDPATYDLTVTGEHQGDVTSYTVSSHIGLFGDALRVADHLGVNVSAFRQRVISFIPFAYPGDLEAVFHLAPHIKSHELSPVIDIYKEQRSDLWRHMPSNLIGTVERFHLTDAMPIMKMFVAEATLSIDARQRALTLVESFIPDEEYLQKITAAYQESVNHADLSVAETARNLLITNHSDPTSIRRKLQQVAERAAPFTRARGGHAVGGLEEELIGGRGFAGPLMNVKARGFENDYLLLLDSASSLWARGRDYYSYATYLWDIVYAYFDNLKELGSYEPIEILEKKLASMRDKAGSNWLTAKMVLLRRSYLMYLGKPQNIAEAIQQYNKARHRDNKKIVNSQDLMNQLREVFDTDLTRWIQAEGAYDFLLSEKVYKSRNQPYEKLIQQTLKSQIEAILLKRGFQIDIVREPQLLDGSRADLLVRYGFAGPLVVEVKLTSNKDLQASEPQDSASYKKMRQYMLGYGASHGVLLMVDNNKSKKLESIRKAYEEIPNVWVKIFDYRPDKNAERKTRKSRTTTRTRIIKKG